MWIVVAAFIVLLSIAPVAQCSAQNGNGAVETSATPVTVEDSIRMLEVSSFPDGEIARFSPDGSRFVIVTKRGNVGTNSNEYSLLLFRSDQVFHSATTPARTLVTLSSSSNRPAIQNIKWVDEHRISFLGENSGETQQLHLIDCVTGRITKLTHHSTNLVSYTMVARTAESFFIADSAVEPLVGDTTRRTGLIVSSEPLSDLIAVKNERQSGEHKVLFRAWRGKEQILAPSGDVTTISAIYPSPELSPDGRYLVVKTKVTGNIPSGWIEYQDSWIKREIRQNRPALALYRFELIDTKSGESQIMLNAPSGFAHSEVGWAPDGRSVVISGTYLPLAVNDPEERNRRRSKRFAVEITLPRFEVAIITDRDLKFRRWDSTIGPVLFQLATGNDVIAYKKTNGEWKPADYNPSERFSEIPLNVTVEDDINTPPRVFVRDRLTGRRSLLLDPNPQFKRLKFGKVEHVAFKATNGKAAEGALYLPPDYVSGTRYPLVIQTHAYNLDRFSINGPYTTAFAAQPLAGRNIIVVQLVEDNSRIHTPNEVSDEASVYEGVVDYLDARGLIDRERVGIIAFSRTGMPVELALTHSRCHFAAASLADISDAGYFRYIALLNIHGFAEESEDPNGGMPFGDGINSWLKNAPGFSLDMVTSPIRLEANYPMGLFFEWEWFAALSRLNKPVELIYIPDGGHVLVKPWDRLISQQGNVDWFDFWLNGHEDPDSSKTKQYARWHQLRKLQHTNQVSPPQH